MFGYYENDYIIYMLQLLAFAAAALLLGLVIRMPVYKCKEFHAAAYERYRNDVGR